MVTTEELAFECALQRGYNGAACGADLGAHEELYTEGSLRVSQSIGLDLNSCMSLGGRWVCLLAYTR